MNRLSHSNLGAVLRLIFVGFTVLAASTSATVFESGDRVRISNLHTIDDDIFIWSSNVLVEGTIDGDAFIGGYDIASSGEVTGSENIFAYTVNHDGDVFGSLRIFANSATVGGTIGRSFLALSPSLRLEPGAVVNRDAHIIGQVAQVDGHIRGNLNFYGSEITISGRVDGNVDLEADKIIIDPPCVIDGDFSYIARKSVVIDTAGGVIILGAITQKEDSAGQNGDEGESSGELTDITFTVSKFLAAFLFGVIIISVFRRYTEETYRQLKGSFGLSAASGVGALLVTVFCIAILLVALILVIIGLALASENEVIIGSMILVVSTLLVPITSFVSVSGGVLFYSGKIVMGMLVGCWLWQRFRSDCAPLSKLQLFVGLVLLTVLFQIPYVGFPIYLIASIIGAGGIVQGVRNCHKSSIESATPAASHSESGPSVGRIESS